jgi:hypothetical protein
MMHNSSAKVARALVCTVHPYALTTWRSGTPIVTLNEQYRTATQDIDVMNSNTIWLPVIE